MDDIDFRSRYARYNMQSRKRKKNSYDKGIFQGTFMRQLTAVVAILLILYAFNQFPNKTTVALNEKVKGILLYNIELQPIYESFNEMMSRIIASRTLPKEEFSMQEDAVAASAEITEEREEKIRETNVTDSQEDTISDTNNKEEDLIKANYTFLTPVVGKVGSGYGTRIDPILNVEKFHGGIDIEANKGTSIKASLGGEVIEAQNESTFGLYIKIKHADGIETLYAHCSQLIAKKGQKVAQGTVIAKVGDTGTAVGSHLHFEIRKDGKTLNPLNYIKMTIK